jgi:hypothetical protein
MHWLNSLVIFLAAFAICNMTVINTSAALSTTVNVSFSGEIVHNEFSRIVDFETGDFSQVTPSGMIHGEDTASTPIIVENIVHSGLYSAQCSLPNPSQYRSSDIDLWSWSPETLPPLSYSFWIYVNPGYNASAWNLITEWNSPAPYYAGRHIDLSFANNGARQNELYLHFFSLSWVPTNYCIQSGVSLPTGQWVNFLIYFKTSMIQGEIKVTMNDNVIIDYIGRTQFDSTNGNTAIQWEVANYCDYSNPPHSFWFDDISIRTG